MANILIVDDDASNRKLLAALLSHDGHVTFEAQDGADALEAAREARPQLVISDILMPTMDGFEFLRRLRAVAELKHIPVILYTAHYHEREAQHLSMAGGAARVLLKPCPAEKLLQAVEQVLAGVSESDEDTLLASFDREHLLLITNKLAEKANALSASNERFKALAKLNVAVAAERDPRAQLQKACEGTRSLLGSRFALLVATSLTGSDEPIFATSGVDFAGVAPEPPRLHAGSLREVLHGRNVYRVSGSDAGAIDLGLPAGYPAANALLAVSMATPTRAYGWLCLGDKIGATEFESEDEEVLSILGTQIALLHESTLARADARRHMSHFYTLLTGMTPLMSQARTQEEVSRVLQELARGISIALDGFD